MTAVENEALLAPGRARVRPLATGGAESVELGRTTRSDGLAGRDRLAVATIGGGFLATAFTLSMLLPSDREPGLAVVALLVGIYALLSRVEFELFTGSSVPTQLVVVPMLFVLPLGQVPLAVAAGLMVGGLVDWARGQRNLERSLLHLIVSWHVVGPVLVLAFAADRLRWSSWLVYLVALGTQFLFELASAAFGERLVHGTPPRLIVRYLARGQSVDAILAPVGLAFAFVAQDEPFAVLLVLPLAGLLSVFARERRARIDNALELSSAYRGTAFLLGEVVEADDAYTGLHSRDVVELSVAVAEELGLDASERRQTELVALLHDVGKIRIPGEIINKPGPLDPDERAIMETHTVEGERMLERVGGLLAETGRIVRSCHERWDGDGYPDGLASDAIPRVARIVMCCDAFSAMTTDRSYRRALSLDAALAELEEHRGTQFDPEVVDALVRRLSHGRPSAALESYAA